METKTSPITNINTNEEKPLATPKKPQNQEKIKTISNINNGNTLDNYFQNLTKMKRTRPESEENNSGVKDTLVEPKDKKELSRINNLINRNRIK